MGHVEIQPDLCTDLQRDIMARWIRQGTAWAHPFTAVVYKRCVNPQAELDRLNMWEGFPRSAMKAGD